MTEPPVVVVNALSVIPPPTGVEGVVTPDEKEYEPFANIFDGSNTA